MTWVWTALVALSDLIEHHLGAITAVIATAAVVQWWETRKTAERQLRAYVLNSSVGLIDGTNITPAPHIDRADQPGVMIEIKNFGTTPAKQVVHLAEMQVSIPSREGAMTIATPLPFLSPSVIGPGGTSTKNIWLDRALSAQEKTGIQTGQYAIFVFGRIEYKDAFGNARWSTYRFKYSGSAWPPYNKSVASMSFCDSGNDTD